MNVGIAAPSGLWAKEDSVTVETGLAIAGVALLGIAAYTLWACLGGLFARKQTRKAVVVNTFTAIGRAEGRVEQVPHKHVCGVWKASAWRK